MTAEEFEYWLSQQPGLLTYLGLLLAGSLVSFVILTRRISKMSRLGDHPVTPWQLSHLDFGLFLVALILWFLLSGTLLVEVYGWIAGPEAQPSEGIMVLGGILMQAGMLYLFLRFRFHYRNPNEGPLSPRILGLAQAVPLGLFYFLASLPVIYGVGMAWNFILELLRARGWQIDLPMQDAVLLFQQADNPIVVTGMLLLAVVVAPVVEECVFRGGIYRFAKGRASITVSLFVSGLLFGLVHGNLQSLPGLIAVGVCLGVAYELSGSIKVPILFHAFFNLNSIIWILLIPENLQM